MEGARRTSVDVPSLGKRSYWEAAPNPFSLVLPFIGCRTAREERRADGGEGPGWNVCGRAEFREKEFLGSGS